MPWFVCFEYPPEDRLGFWRNRIGLSAPDQLSKDDAIAEVRQSLEGKGHKNLSLFDVFKYQEKAE